MKTLCGLCGSTCNSASGGRLCDLCGKITTLMVKKIIPFIVLVFTVVAGYSQNGELSGIITEIAEELAIDESDPEAVSMYVEQLHELTGNPVNINSGDESEISRLFFLSDFQVKAIADYVMSSGKIVSVYEIASLPGFDRRNTEMIIPFIELSSKNINSPDTIHLRNTFLSNLIFKPGEADTSLTGSSYKLLTKYRFTAGRFAGGFTLEKDRGEKLISGSPPLPDFLSGYLTVTGKGIIKRVIIGDFASRFGQGININTGIRTGLSVTAPGYMAGRNEIRPYTSTDENNFFRGAAAQLSMKKTGITLFFSYNKIDASTFESPDSSMSCIGRFYETGLHDNNSGILKKDAVAETSFGINLTWSFRYLNAGLSWSESRFSLPVVPDKSDPETLYDFEGSRNQVWSVHYNSLLNKILLYGEFSLNDIQNYAIVQGATLRPSDRLTINFLYRYYTPGYTSFHGNGPGSSSSNCNEQGLLGNFTFEAARHLFISAGCDISRYEWLRYRCSFPSRSGRMEIKLKYLPRENLAFDFSYYLRYTMLDSEKVPGIPGIEETESRTLKGQVRYGISENLTLLTRIDYKIADPSGSRGMLFLQDAILSLKQLPVTLWLRYCMFKTDDWNSRLYTYENDLLYSFSIPALSGTGTRSYIMAKWEIGERAELRIKYALTSLISEKDINEEKDEIKLQFRIWF